MGAAVARSFLVGGHSRVHVGTSIEASTLPAAYAMSVTTAAYANGPNPKLLNMLLSASDQARAATMPNAVYTMVANWRDTLGASGGGSGDCGGWGADMSAVVGLPHENYFGDADSRASHF